jgi:hypothetical protein
LTGPDRDRHHIQTPDGREHDPEGHDERVGGAKGTGVNPECPVAPVCDSLCRGGALIVAQRP